MRTWYTNCGYGVRPHIFTPQAPKIGTTFYAHYNIFSLPREDGIYSTMGAWLILSTQPPRNYEEPVIIFDGPPSYPDGQGSFHRDGCPLLWNLNSPFVFVWSFGGVLPYEDVLVKRERNGRAAVLRLVIPNDRAFVGQRFYTQMLTAEAGPTVKMSQLLEIVIGD